MRKFASAAVLSMAFVFSTPSLAAAPSEQPPTRVRWYGYQTLLVDLASVGMVIAAGATKDGGPAVFGVGGYIFGGPVVHAIHGRYATGAISLLLRLGLPAAGGGLAYAAAGSCTTKRDGSGCEWEGLGKGLTTAFGASIGAGLAILIDGTALARETVPFAPSAPSVTASISPVPGGALFGASGTF
ncbi:hypothetical protein [Pendulispora albinea]|uniref:Uncharacterized protein n=1 Tax=Pendulispora albinea TaxID=2741071 RepID=A0ABZ2M0Y9_9BACT